MSHNNLSAKDMQERLDRIQSDGATPEEKEKADKEAAQRRFVRPKKKPYVREYPKNFKKTWKEFQKALTASPEFSLMQFLTLLQPLKEMGIDEQVAAEAALRQGLAMFHPYDMSTNPLVISTLKKIGVVIKDEPK